MANDGGITGKGFAKGRSGNPGGRPSIAKALAANGLTAAEVVAKLVKIAWDALDGTGAKGQIGREYAHTWLTHYTLGKPVAAVDLNVSGEAAPAIVNIDALTLEQRTTMLGLLEQAAEKPAAAAAAAADDDDA